MAENALRLISIKELNGMNFFIPSFQRGYRWEQAQVEALLDDIKEYIQKPNETFMCLQPVVFYEKKDSKDEGNNKLVIIDGQQRLTALAIIDYFLKAVSSTNSNEVKNIYTIQYEKYKLSNDPYKSLHKILSNIHELEKLYNNEQNTLYNTVLNMYNDNNGGFNSLDEYHIILSYLIIKSYFAEKEDDKEDFKMLFNSSEENFSVKFIWYDVTNEIEKDKQKAVEIFTRLNIGKIPLTNAELIKALFLKQDNFLENNHEKIYIANMWHEIENTLNNDSFWYFLSKSELPRSKRINLLLMLNTDIQKIEDIKDYNLFREYYKQFQNSQDSKLYNNIWSEVEHIYYTLKEWYNNYEMFHYIGYLINTTDYSLKDLYKKYHNCKQNNKLTQREEIKSLVRETVKDISIEEITYDNTNDVKKILLFLEIYSSVIANKKNSLNEITYRFPFNLYIAEKWDIEHISSQTENKFQKNNDKFIWFVNNIDFIKKNDKNGLQEIKENLKEIDESKTLVDDIINNQQTKTEEKIKKFIEKNWDKIYTAFEKYFATNYSYNYNLGEDSKNSLGNLVLLNSNINRAYKNAIFPVKRMVIIEESKKGVFIPINTKNAFLKYFNTTATDNLNYWEEKDRANYINYIKQQIDNFINPRGDNNGNNR